ncbi:unnamed protein product [Kuraishia capsulata CBS 1993]|uniref:PUA domain-containing protein n=1 Tax=Kuraishia capsulata CBS 1993 TaxID=1382522 RepID=W6MK68_9ASCO|nr:uncharacterized protein KUCA_T00002360001 [Kuraishia capsulata CBS 1993]CDK26388.1 unnamed protein product [Kuraishia capsulata CBS 1993]
MTLSSVTRLQPPTNVPTAFQSRENSIVYITMANTPEPKTSYTIVVKLGSSSIVDEVTKEPKISIMSRIVETLVKLRRDGHKVVIVSSGAIATGLKHLSLDKRPKKLAQVQALAAIGQGRLITLWDSMFRHFNQVTAQILFTRNDITDYTQFKNAENTLEELINMGVIPIVNENDTLSVQEIKFGDNDTLSAITAGMCHADFLFLLTDVDCLYTDNPRTNPEAKPVLVVRNMKNLNVNTKSTGSAIGTGGMTTKLIAADLGTSAGVTTVICKSTVPENILAIVNHSKESDVKLVSDEEWENESFEDFEKLNSEEFNTLQRLNLPLHTRFIGQSVHNTIKDKEFWLLHGLKPAGELIIDLGCYKAITRKEKAGLLPVGVITTEGTFHESECVELKVGVRDSNGDLDRSTPLIYIGRGRCNYTSSEIEKIKGYQSNQIESILGFADSEYVIHRENLAFPPHQDIDVEGLLKEYASLRV